MTPDYIRESRLYWQRRSLYINGHSTLAARVSCGSVVDMCTAVAQGRVRNGFAVVRCGDAAKFG